jgi:glyoxylase-like metal-dependent hydrolase (beta-lactamase superfamily II)
MLKSKPYLRRRRNMMNNESYGFRLGDFKCVSIMDGSHDYPLENFFANVPKEKVEEVLRRLNLPTDHIMTPYTYLFVDTGKHKVLVDIGAGNVFPTTGRLLQNMRAAGIEPGEIDTVFITHAHPDHIGGNLDKEGSPIFLNASYYIWKDEWDFWFSEVAFEKTNEMFVKIARTNLEPIKDRVKFLNHDSEILPGISVIAAPGHTPGHFVVSIASGDEQLLYIGDTVLYPIHLEHLDWIPVYDIVPEKAAASKRRIFDLAADEKTWIIGQHFPPFPSLGHVIKKGNGWQWQPNLHPSGE